MPVHTDERVREESRDQMRVLGLNADFITINTGHLESELTESPVILDTNSLNEPVPWGSLSGAAGRAAIAAIEAGARLCLAKKLDAITTAPINKESLKLAGSPFPGHTEMLTALCGVSESLMCFFSARPDC